MTTDNPGLPLPPAVLARLRTAETLRAEVTGLTAERDALREELQTAAWERDTAQNESSYLRTEMYPANAEWLTDLNRYDVGRVLTMGDEPPAAPEDGRTDIALVSISTGEVYVRSTFSPMEWSKYGETTSVRDWPSLAESGPWIVVDGWRYRDHRERGEKRRQLRSALYHGYPRKADYPEGAANVIDSLEALQAQRYGRDDDEAFIANLLSNWQTLAGVTRSEWAEERRRNDRLVTLLRQTPHDAEWCSPGTPEPVCTYCGIAKSEHIGSDASQKALA